MITTDDLLDALRAALCGPGGDGHTVQELCEACNCGSTKVRAELSKMHRAGRLAVIRVRRPDMTGRMQSIPAYRMKDA
jgi:hypothetical protein